MTADTECPECGARYSAPDDSCEARFERLLALDHSRREPWGSRHGQAFAVFALQHPRRFSASLDAAWAALYRIYCLDQPPSGVFEALRARGGHSANDPAVPPRPRPSEMRPTITIADLGDFLEREYPSQLDAWCQATLRAWGAPIGTGATNGADAD
jgi:hypothetical protein